MGTPLNQPLLLHSLPLHSLPINPPIAQPTNRLIHQTTNSVNMKFTLAVAASMAATTMANPILGKHWGQRWGHNKAEVAESSPFDFTSTYEVIAVPEQVVDANNTFTGGLKGARGVYKFGLNSKENVICYNITITGFQGEYQSPAISATHIHEAVKGKAGPPRIAFPNPVQVTNCKDTRRSIGCIAGTKDGFVTGVVNVATGKDNGFGFSVKKIEENPAGFFADVHSSKAVPGAIRGQIE